MMKNYLFPTFLLAILFLISCKKNQGSACISPSKIEYQWNNAYILEQFYNATNTVITGSSTIYPVGSFTLNSGGLYNVNSNGVPLNGSWEINQSNCQLILDKGTSVQRSFNVDLVTVDSLTISRRDTANNVVYRQHYFRNQ